LQSIEHIPHCQDSRWQLPEIADIFFICVKNSSWTTFF